MKKQTNCKGKSQKESRRCQKSLIALLSAMLLTSCTSTQQKITITHKPTIPDPVTANGDSVIKYDEETNTVSMPFDYFIGLAKYINETEVLLEYFTEK